MESWHIMGQLQLADEDEVRELMDMAMPILRTVKGCTIILLGPLICYLTRPCCENAEHISNFSTVECSLKLLTKTETINEAWPLRGKLELMFSTRLP